MEIAKINLGYAHVTAPFAGRIGRRQVDPGNLVGVGSATTIAKLEQMSPIYVNFNLNERDALHLREMMQKAGIAPKSSVGKAPIIVGLNNEEGYPHAGILDFADNDISDASTPISYTPNSGGSDKVLINNNLGVDTIAATLTAAATVRSTVPTARIGTPTISQLVKSAKPGGGLI